MAEPVALPVEYLDHYNFGDWGPLKYAHAGDAGFDLRAALDQTTILYPHNLMKVPTGVKMALPEGYELQVRPRSGLAARGVTVVNAPGTVDAGFRGEIHVLLLQMVNRPVRICPGDRIAQAVLAPVTRATLQVHSELHAIPAVDARGERGFGSTGVG